MAQDQPGRWENNVGSVPRGGVVFTGNTCLAGFIARRSKMDNADRTKQFVVFFNWPRMNFD